MPGIIKATKDKETKRQIRYKIEKNKYGFSGVFYFPKDKAKDSKKGIPERLKIQIAFDRD